MSFPQDDPTRPSTTPAWSPPPPPGTTPPPPPETPPPAWAPQAPPQAPYYVQQPVEPVRRGGSLRWALAAAVLAVVLVGGVALAFFASSGQSTAALGPTYLPAGTIAYVEARLDLPGDQRSNLVSFLGRFPGLADPATFEQKVNDTLDRLTRQSSGDRLVYTRDIKPWFEGEISIGITALPAAAAGGGGLQDVPFVGALSVSDRGALELFLQTVRAELQAQGTVFTESAHGGTTIVTIAGGTPMSYAVTDDLLYFAVDIRQIQAALDVRAGTRPSLAESEPFKSRFAKLPTERLGAFFVDLTFLPGVLAGMGQLDELGIEPETLPTGMAGTLRVESDRVIADVHTLLGTASPVPGNRTTTLAQHIPAGTLFFTEQRDVGTAIRMILRQLKAVPGVLPDEQLRQLELALGTPAEEAFTWIGDAALAVSVDGDRIRLGLVATVTDETVAAQRIAAINTLVRAGIALGGDAPVEVVEESVAGAMLTTIRSTDGLPPGLPFEPSLSYTLNGGVFYLGVGDFVATALQQPAETALSADARYTSAVDAAGGATNAGVVYVDLTGIRQTAEHFLLPIVGVGPGNQMYQTEVKPYIEPFDRFVIVYQSRDAAIETRLVLLVQ